MRGVGGFLWEMVRRDYTCRGFFFKAVLLLCTYVPHRSAFLNVEVDFSNPPPNSFISPAPAPPPGPGFLL